MIFTSQAYRYTMEDLQEVTGGLSNGDIVHALE